MFGLGGWRRSAVAVTVPRRRLTRLAVSDSIRDLAGTQARDRAEMADDGRMGSRRRRLGRLHRGRPPRAGEHADAGHDLSATGGLAALSLDALSSVAYGPEAMVLVLIAAGTSGLRFTVPLTLVITGMLVLDRKSTR